MDHIWCIFFIPLLPIPNHLAPLFCPSVKVLHLEGDMSNTLFISIPSLLMREGNNNKGLVNKEGGQG
jgi:hypothetical protein